MSLPHRLAHARHAFFRLAGPIPLGYDGAPLRSAIRANSHGALALATAWRTALNTLHRAGFGTDDALGHALVTTEVAFDPRGVFPLGATTGRRPVAAWLDLDEARRWLVDQGAAPELVAVFSAPPPWPHWPAPPSALFSLVGPPDECRALCEAARIDTVDARTLPLLTWASAEPTSARLVAAAHLRRLPQALLSRRPLAILVAPEENGRLPLPARLRIFAASTGASPLGPDDAYEAFGLERFEPPEPPPPFPVARALEDARLCETAAARAAAEATALLVAQVDAAARDLPPLDPDRAVDLARDGLERAATQRAHLLRALLSAPHAPKRALADLTEARRLHKDEVRATAVARALHRLISHLVGVEPPEGGEDAPLMARLADEMAIPVWDEELATYALAVAASAGLDLPELGPALVEAATGLVIERIGRDAILDATEEQTERLLMRLLATMHLPASVSVLAKSWAAVCASRRGAVSSVRERLIAAADGLRGAARPWVRLAAERYALAARSTRLDGLVPLFLDTAQSDSPLARELGGVPSLHLEPHLSPWLATLALEGLRRFPEGERRRAWPILAAAIPPRPGCDLALGALLAGAPEDLWAGPDPTRGTVGVIDAVRARELLKRTAHGEPHHERWALTALARLPGGDEVEREAIARRLKVLGRMPAEEPEGEPPLDPASAERRVLALVADLVGGAAGQTPYEGWRRALVCALGEPQGDVPPASCARDGLTLVEDGAGWLLEPLSGEAPIRFAGPGHPTTASAPELAAKALAALAPLFLGAEERPASELRPEALDDALRAGELDFFSGVIQAFKRRELLLPTLRAAIDLGLTETRGLYRALATRWRITDYHRFMDFLRRNDALLDYRPYRRGA